MPAFYFAPTTEMVNVADGEQAVVDFFTARGFSTGSDSRGRTLLIAPSYDGMEHDGILCYPVSALWGWLYRDGGTIKWVSDDNGRPGGYLPVPD